MELELIPTTGFSPSLELTVVSGSDSPSLLGPSTTGDYEKVIVAMGLTHPLGPIQKMALRSVRTELNKPSISLTAIKEEMTGGRKVVILGA